jgi:hypothetical protein
VRSAVGLQNTYEHKEDRMKTIEHFRRAFRWSALILVLTASIANHAATQAMPTGLVSWWRGEGNANDSANANNSTLVGNTAFASGQLGQAFGLDGAGDFVDFGNASNLHVSAGDFTVVAWVNFDSLGSPCGPGSGCDMAILAKMLRVSGRGPAAASADPPLCAAALRSRPASGTISPQSKRPAPSRSM